MSQETWILLRGLTRESGHWGDFVPLLQRRWPEARIVTPDLPGNGLSCDQPSPTRVAAMTEACRRQLQVQGIAPPYTLLAMSLGGMVAVDWASRHPEELDGAVLINTSLGGLGPWHWRLRPANGPALLRLAWLARRAPRAAEAIVLKMTSRHHAGDDALLDDWTRLRQLRPVSPANALRQLWAALRFRLPARKPATPLLVLASPCDALVDVRCSLRLARRWHTALSQHPSAGHDLPLDDGPWVAQQIEHWRGQA